MPLSKTGRKILNEFVSEYGKKKGKEIFYAWEKTHKWVKQRGNK
jgi:hypothetical protein